MSRVSVITITLIHLRATYTTYGQLPSTYLLDSQMHVITAEIVRVP